MSDTRRLRKILLDALRHDPDSLGLTLDDEGFAPLTDILYGYELYTEYIVPEMSLHEVINGSHVLEVRDDKVRATRGHTTEQFEYPTAKPPETLLYIEHSSKVEDLLEKGLQNNRVKYIELAETEESAEDTARLRRVKKGQLVRVRAEEAYRAGTLFFMYCGVWYTQEIDPAFLEVT